VSLERTIGGNWSGWDGAHMLAGVDRSAGIHRGALLHAFLTVSPLYDRTHEVLTLGRRCIGSDAAGAEGIVKRSKWSGESVEEVLGLARRRGGAVFAVGRERRSEGWALDVSRCS